MSSPPNVSRQPSSQPEARCGECGERSKGGTVRQPQARIAIIGGGPGGYEAALVAAQLGAAVTVIERDGLGGACVLTDCVPSKTLIASSARMAALDSSAALGIQLSKGATVDAPRLNARIRSLARA